MKRPTIRLVFDRKHKATKTRKGTVQLEVLYDKKRKWLSTGVHLYSGQWNERKYVINSNVAGQLNEQLHSMMREVGDFINALYAHGEEYTHQKLDAFLNKKKAGTFLEYVAGKLEAKQMAEGTRAHHRQLLKELRGFGGIVEFSDLTRSACNKFYEYERSRTIKDKAGNVVRKVSTATVHNYMKWLHLYIREALRDEHISNDPMEAMKIETGKAAMRRYLTEEELQQLQTAELSDARLERTRDLFLFQCYTGLSYADLVRIDFEHDVEMRDGRHVIIDRRKKTDTDFFIVLLSPAVAILQKYNNRLPVITNTNYNLYLKEVAFRSRIDKRLTTHVGRHTFATWALNRNVPIEAVAKILGHTNIKTTQIYAHIVQKSVVSAFDQLEKALK